MKQTPAVFGVQVDLQTRCAHYHQTIDIIAIKHFCCQKYYPCHLCHAQLAGHPVIPWPAQRFADPAILCGACGTELSITEYLKTTHCPRCEAQFNPGCKLHLEFYFET